MVKVNAKFQRMSAGFGFPVGATTYTFRDENKELLQFHLYHYMDGPTPDTGAEGILTYEDETIISFEFDDGVLINRKWKG